MPAVAAVGLPTGRVRNTTGPAASKHARYALWTNPENLTEQQATSWPGFAKTDPRLRRAYLLMEGLRHVFVVRGQAGKEAQDRRLAWAARTRSRIRAFVALGKKIRKHRATHRRHAQPRPVQRAHRVHEYQDPAATNESPSDSSLPTR